MRWLGGVVAFGFCTALAAAEVKVGVPAPGLAGVVDEKGQPAAAPSYAGQVVVVTFGASWCKPCKKELKALNTLAGTLAEQKQPVTFVAVNFDSKLKTGVDFVKGLGLPALRVLYDPDKKVTEVFDPQKMPTIFIVTNGKVAHVHGGFEKGDDAKLGKLVKAELGKIPRTP